MDDHFIDYGRLIDDAMHVIVQKALQKVVKEGLPGKHHFFISFATSYPGVQLSEHLKSRYPEEMTIVLQHQFDELKVDEKGFSVTLSFDNIKEPIYVPFDALIAFADPSVKFGLQFRHIDEPGNVKLEASELKAKEKMSNAIKQKSTKKTTKKSKDSQGSDNVVSIDTFRKK